MPQKVNNLDLERPLPEWLGKIAERKKQISSEKHKHTGGRQKLANGLQADRASGDQSQGMAVDHRNVRYFPFLQAVAFKGATVVEVGVRLGRGGLPQDEDLREHARVSRMPMKSLFSKNT